MLVSEVMTHNVEILSPEATIREAAELMRAVDAGALPVCDGTRLVGMVTDRDIVVRGIALGCTPDSPVTEVMSSQVVWIRDDAEAEDAARIMRERQVRRLPVIDENRKLVGIISLGDLTQAVTDREAGATLETISEPWPSLTP
ncbi:MAG: CBS domain-containing protein [Myxococcaceae bacterium]|nr:CBS domain-containing protein [Myxococcaceae bacterium]MCI0672784.1 CBS domain-containing protein [Myxococcaceae bacterium]